MPGGLPVTGDDDGQHVAQVGGAPAFGDEHRPVLVDQPDAQFARDVGCSEHRLDALDGRRRRCVDPHRVGPGVVGEVQGCVEESGRPQVVDERPVSQAQLGGLVLDAAAADTATGHSHRHLVPGQRLDGVEDLDVAGAAAEVGAEVAGDIVTCEGTALPVDLRLGPHQDARRAEPALEGAVGGEGRRIPVPLRRVESLEGHARCPLGLLHRRLARDACLPVEQDGAAAALSGRCTAVLG